MLVDVTMTELARKLADEVRASSYRDMQAKTGVSRGSLEKIIRAQPPGDDGIPNNIPEFATLEKLAAYWKLPLYRVVEMAGVDLGLPRSIDELSQQLISLATRLPEIEPIVQYLLKLYPEDLRGVVAYLESVDRQNNRDRGWSGEGIAPRQ